MFHSHDLSQYLCCCLKLKDRRAKSFVKSKSLNDTVERICVVLLATEHRCYHRQCFICSGPMHTHAGLEAPHCLCTWPRIGQMLHPDSALLPTFFPVPSPLSQRKRQIITSSLLSRSISLTENGAVCAQAVCASAACPAAVRFSDKAQS